MPASETPDQHRARFRWLHREGVLSDDELQERLSIVDATDPARMQHLLPEAGRLN